MGDFVCSLPALEHLAAQAAETEVWCAGVNVPLVRFGAQARSIASTGLDLLELGLAPASLRAKLASFDRIHSWYGAGRAEFREAMAGFPVTFHVALPVSPDVHAVDYYLDQVGATRGAVPRLPLSEPDGGYLAIHPFSGSGRKNWGLGKFRELAAGLGMPVEWCAGPEEELEGARRFDSLWEMARWLAGARLYAGNDSGPSHVAAACGTPAVVIFGPSDPRVWAPRGPNVTVVAGDLEKINPKQVLQSIRR